MSVWVKVCGLTSAEAVAAAVESGADAIGFVFAPSPRQVTADQALVLAQAAPAHIARVAVTRRPDQAQIDAIAAIFKPDLLQLDVEDIATVSIAPDLDVLPVFRRAPLTNEKLPSRILFEGPRSGVGELADWSAAAHAAQRTNIVLAGGLDPSNVADAIARVAPYGVDVSSGVESAPGVKDPKLVAYFIRAARAAQQGRSSHG